MTRTSPTGGRPRADAASEQVVGQLLQLALLTARGQGLAEGLTGRDDRVRLERCEHRGHGARLDALVVPPQLVEVAGARVRAEAGLTVRVESSFQLPQLHELLDLGVGLEPVACHLERRAVVDAGHPAREACDAEGEATCLARLGPCDAPSEARRHRLDLVKLHGYSSAVRVGPAAAALSAIPAPARVHPPGRGATAC